MHVTHSLGTCSGGVENVVYTICACMGIYSTGPVNVCVDELSHMAQSSTEALYNLVSGRSDFCFSTTEMAF